jgi:DNA topoisomerase-3
MAYSLQQGGFAPPRKGKHDDKAHPPIHPTAHAANLVGDHKRVYEYVTRRFLACCSKDAEGWETTVDIVCGGENFFATGETKRTHCLLPIIHLLCTGLVILERHYLVVYPYDKWSAKEIPEFNEGEEFQPSVCELTEGKTSSPTYLTEADLVSLMDKNGIGM